jgi:hypothetical protein
MAQLKLVLSGTDPESIPILSPEKVSKVPARLLEILHDIGRVLDLGNIKVITISDNRHHFIIKKTIEFCDSGRLQHDELTVERNTARRPVRYQRARHEHDTTFTATSEAHTLFLEHVRLYKFCLRTGFRDFQTYLSNSLSTHYPVYEVEVIALLNELYKDSDTLENVDHDLLNFIGQRMVFLRDILANSKSLLPLLRARTDAKDHLLAIVRHADNASLSDELLTHVRTELRIEESTETTLLLDTFVAKHRNDTAVAQSDQTLPSTPAASGRLSRSQNNIVTLPVTVHPAPSNTTTAAPKRKRSRSSAPEEVSRSEGVTTTRPRRPHPDNQIYDFDASSTPGAPKTLHRVRPRIENEYWSVTPEKWDSFGDDSKRCYTHAGLICETEAGTIAPEPCSNCLELGEVCEVYNTADARNLSFGGACARCRVTWRSKCSHSEVKRTRKTHSG